MITPQTLQWNQASVPIPKPMPNTVLQILQVLDDYFFFDICDYEFSDQDVYVHPFADVVEEGDLLTPERMGNKTFTLFWAILTIPQQ